MVCLSLVASNHYHLDPDANNMIHSDILFTFLLLHSNKDQPFGTRGQKQGALCQGETQGDLLYC